MPTIPGRRPTANGADQARIDQTRITRALDDVMAAPDFRVKWANAAEVDAQRRREELAAADPPDVDPELEAIARAQLDAAEDHVRGSWWPEDFEDVLDGSYAPPEPTVGRRTDGAGLFYPGRTHSVVSESEAGKSWLALAAAADEMRAGNTVVYLDFEDDRGGIVGRLLTMGTARDVLRARFLYVHPQAALAGDHVTDLLDVLVEHQPTLVILDGVTEAMAVHGMDPLGNFDAAKFGHMVTARLTSTGAAVVALDHVTKDREGRGRYAIGAVHKLNGLNGAQYVLENRSPFGIGLNGRSTLRIAKDRPGQLRRRGVAGTMVWYGDLVMSSTDEDYAEVTVEPPREHDDDFRPTVLMGRVAAAIAEHGELSQRSIRTAVGGKATTATYALDCLILDGYVTEKSPHKLIRPYLPDVSDDPEN